MCRTPSSPPSARPCTYGRPMTTASAPRASARCPHGDRRLPGAGPGGRGCRRRPPVRARPGARRGGRRPAHAPNAPRRARNHPHHRRCRAPPRPRRQRARPGVSAGRHVRPDSPLDGRVARRLTNALICRDPRAWHVNRIGSRSVGVGQLGLTVPTSEQVAGQVTICAHVAKVLLTPTVIHQVLDDFW